MGASSVSNFLPGALKVRKVSFGIASDSPDVTISGSTGSFTLFNVDIGTVVRDVEVYITTKFDSTGAFTLNIGDTDVDGFIYSTDLVGSDASTAGIMKASMMGSHHSSTGGVIAPAYRAGRVYTSDDTLAVKATVGTAKINAGLATAYLLYYNLNEV